MRRFSFILVAAAVIAASLGCGTGYRCGDCNVILISIDTLRADHLGIYGYSRDTSPNIDRFAHGAVFFADPIAQASSTIPSHGSIFTSLHPSHHGALYNKGFILSDDSLTIAEILSENGYTTVSFNDGGLMSADFGFGQGFDVYDSTEYKSDFETRVAPAKTWLADDREQPFFLFLHSYEVHLPLDPDRRYVDLFESGYGGTLPDHLSEKVLRQIRGSDIKITDDDLDHIVALYDATIRSMDAAFEDLIGFLKDNDLYDTSLIIFTSDHGEEYGERGRIAVHGPTLHDEVIRVPLIVKMPYDRFAGTVVEQHVGSIDIVPTILDVLGIEAPSHFEGASLMHLVRGIESKARPILSETLKGKLASLRDGSWKLHRGSRASRLFDLATDPSESTDVAADHEETVDRMLAEIEKIQSSRPSKRTAREPDERKRERLRALGYID